MTLERFAAVFIRDFRKFLSNPIFVVVMFLIPLLTMAICGNSLGGYEAHIPVGVVQGGILSEETPLFQNAVYYLNHVPQSDADLAYKGKVLDVTVYSNENSAMQDLENGKISAVVVFPPSVTDDDSIYLYMDSTERLETPYIQPAVEFTLVSLGVQNPIVVRKIYGNIEYPVYYNTGLLVMTLFTTCMAFGAVSLLRDRESGMNEGYLATRLRKRDIVFGSVVGNTVRAFLVGALMFWVIVIMNCQPTPSLQQFLSIALALLVSCIAISSLLVFLACIIPSQPIFSSISSFLNISLYMTSGAIFPVFGMPEWLGSFTVWNPEHYAVHAIRSTLLRNQGINVYGTDLVILLLFSLGMILLGIAVYRRTLE